MTEVKAYLYVVRHGETNYNRERRIQGTIDVPLNENGLEQAGYVAAELSKERLDVVASSNLKRAVQTADAIYAEQKQEPRPVRIIEENLHELCFGDFDGHYLDDDSGVAKEFKRIWNLWGVGNMTEACPTVRALRMCATECALPSFGFLKTRARRRRAANNPTLLLLHTGGASKLHLARSFQSHQRVLIW